MTARRRTLWAVLICGSALAAIWIAVLAYGAGKLGPTSVEAFTVDYHDRLLDDGLELLIVQSDGQAFATQARDPFFEHPESFRTTEEAAYRAQRPLLGWMAAIGSVGRSGWVPPAMAVIGSLATGAAAAGAGALLGHRGRSPWLGLFVFFLPGTAGTLSYLGPEPLVLAFLVWGVVAWERDRRNLALGLFVLAVLGRETAILVPFALGVVELCRGDAWATCRRLGVVPAVLIGWFLVVRLRIGAWPWEAGEGRLGPPFVGLWVAARDIWTSPIGMSPHLVLAVVVVAASLLLARSDELTVIVATHGVFATLLGEYVWAEPNYFSRPLLPMYVFGVIASIGSPTFSRRPALRPDAELRTSPST